LSTGFFAHNCTRLTTRPARYFAPELLASAPAKLPSASKPRTDDRTRLAARVHALLERYERTHRLAQREYAPVVDLRLILAQLAVDVAERGSETVFAVLERSTWSSCAVWAVYCALFFLCYTDLGHAALNWIRLQAGDIEMNPGPDIISSILAIMLLVFGTIVLGSAAYAWTYYPPQLWNAVTGGAESIQDAAGAFAGYVAGQVTFSWQIFKSFLFIGGDASPSILLDPKYNAANHSYFNGTHNNTCTLIGTTHIVMLHHGNWSGYNMSNFTAFGNASFCQEANVPSQSLAYSTINSNLPLNSTPCYAYVAEHFRPYHIHWYYWNYQCLKFALCPPQWTWLWDWIVTGIVYVAFFLSLFGGFIVKQLRFRVKEEALKRTEDKRISWEDIPLFYVIVRGIIAPCWEATTVPIKIAYNAVHSTRGWIEQYNPESYAGTFFKWVAGGIWRSIKWIASGIWAICKRALNRAGYVTFYVKQADLTQVADHVHDTIAAGTDAAVKAAFEVAEDRGDKRSVVKANWLRMIRNGLNNSGNRRFELSDQGYPGHYKCTMSCYIGKTRSELGQKKFTITFDLYAWKALVAKHDSEAQSVDATPDVRAGMFEYAVENGEWGVSEIKKLSIAELAHVYVRDAKDTPLFEALPWSYDAKKYNPIDSPTLRATQAGVKRSPKQTLRRSPSNDGSGAFSLDDGQAPQGNNPPPSGNKGAPSSTTSSSKTTAANTNTNTNAANTNTTANTNNTANNNSNQANNAGGGQHNNRNRRRNNNQRRGAHAGSDRSGSDNDTNSRPAASSELGQCSYHCCAFAAREAAQAIAQYCYVKSLKCDPMISWILGENTTIAHIVDELRDLEYAKCNPGPIDARNLFTHFLATTPGPESQEEPGVFLPMGTVLRMKSWYAGAETRNHLEHYGERVVAAFKYTPPAAGATAGHVVFHSQSRLNTWLANDDFTMYEVTTDDLLETGEISLLVAIPHVCLNPKYIWPEEWDDNYTIANEEGDTTVVHKRHYRKNMKLVAELIINVARAIYPRIAKPSQHLYYFSGPHIETIDAVNTLIKILAGIPDEASKQPNSLEAAYQPVHLCRFLLSTLQLRDDDRDSTWDDVITVGKSNPIGKTEATEKQPMQYLIFDTPPKGAAVIAVVVKFDDKKHDVMYHSPCVPNYRFLGANAREVPDLSWIEAVKPTVTRAAYVYATGLDRVSCASSITICEGCDTRIAEHKDSDVVRHCKGCMGVFVGGCTGMSPSAIKSAKRSPPSPNDRSVVLFECPGCIAEVQAQDAAERECVQHDEQRLHDEAMAFKLPSATQSNATQTNSTVVNSPSVTSNASGHAPPAPNPNAPKAPPDAPVTAKAPASKPASKQPAVPNPNTKDPAPKSPHPSPECDGCKQPSRDHAHASSYRKCSKCEKFSYGRCHGEEYRKTRGGCDRNDAKDYTCKSCRPAADKPASNQQQPANDKDQLAPAPPPPEQTNSGDVKHGPPQGKILTLVDSKCPSLQCGGCEQPSKKHAFNKSWRKCSVPNCAKVLYGACHGEDKTVKGAEHNNKANYVCPKCRVKNATDEAQVEARRKQARETDFRDRRCINCDKNALGHDGHEESYRKCSKCECFTLGTCHCASTDVAHNRDEFVCKPCRGIPTDVHKHAAQMDAAKIITDGVEVPNNFDLKPSLGRPDQEDIDSKIPVEANTPTLTGANFQSRLESPPGGAVVSGLAFSQITINDKASDRIAKTQHAQTTTQHIKLLKQLQTCIANSPEWAHLPITRAATRLVLINAKHAGWKPQTLFRTATSLAGALSSLPLYSSALVGVKLGTDPYWQRMIKFWRLHSNQNQPYNQPAASADHVLGAIDSVPDQPETQFMLALQWCTTARVGDILPLRRECVVWEPHSRSLSVKIDEGKVMAKTGPYTIHTLVNEEFADMFTRFLAPLKNPKDRLFPYDSIPRSTRVTRANAALKHAAADLSTRSIRRGALQAMALKGVSIAVLRQFSGHRSDETCKRYLDWGRLNVSDKISSAEAAKHLRITTTSP
jgi:hypothetical protein